MLDFSAIWHIIIHMSLIIITSLFFATMTKPLIIDSIIYAVDLPTMEVREQIITGSIIDYSINDYLYVLTTRYLYKIDPDYLSIRDRIPLPQRFNYIATNIDDIILITSGEIILLDKKNLAFKTGIGIEYGDYRPMITCNNTIARGHNNILHLFTNSERKTIIKIFDLTTGRLLKKRTVSRLLDYRYYADDNLIVTFDIHNRMTLYDFLLNEQSKFSLKVPGKTFERYGDGYLIYSAEAVFSITRYGKLIDYQPVPIEKQEVVERFLFVTCHGIVYLDSLTLRPKAIFKGAVEFSELLRIQSDKSDYAFTLDQNGSFHLLNLSTLAMISMTAAENRMQEKIAGVSTVASDSLWYFQVGAFSSYHNAMQMYDEIRQQNIPVFIDSADLYRIKLGGFQDKLKAIEIVEKANLDGWFVFQKRIEQKDFAEFIIELQKYVLKNGIITRSNP